MNDTLRTFEQNSMLWVLLNDFANQKKWLVNNQECFISAEDWKDLLSACYRKEAQRIAQGIDGGIVLLGARTSKMKIDQMSEFIEYILATGAQMNIKFSAPNWR